MAKLTHPIDGLKLKKLRGRRLLTHSELAKRAAVTEASLRTYERGGASVHASTLKRLAEALSVEPDDLREGEESPELPGLELTRQ